MRGRTWLSLSAFFGLVFYSVGASTQSQCSADAVGGAPADASWANVVPVVREGFESGTMGSAYESGFIWEKGVRTGVISEGFSNVGALQFRFPAGKDGWSEQRFSLGGAYPELWIGYWIKVPANWQHGSNNTNNKFFAIWMDDYERQGPTGVIQTRNKDGSSVVSPYVRNRANRHLGERSGKTLIDISRDRGRWMQIVIHLKMATGPAARNGTFAMYRRRNGEARFENIFAYNDWDNYHVGGNSGFAHGYLMGWANATQREDTEWLLDDFTVSRQSLINPGASPSSISPAPAAFFPKIVAPQG